MIRDWIPSIPILTLTATASTKVKDDIIKILKLNNPYEIIGNFDRPNLTIKIFQRSDTIMNNIAPLLQKYKNEYIKFDFFHLYLSNIDNVTLISNHSKENLKQVQIIYLD